MNLLQAVTLGALQGITEFLPISSSGHLVLAEQWLSLGIDPNDMQGLNVMLHAGTLLALVMAYTPVWWRLLKSPLTGDGDSRRQLNLLVIATIPGAAAGLLLEEFIAAHFQSMLSVGIAFSATGIILIVSERFAMQPPSTVQKVLHPFRTKADKATARGALLIGVAQACALIPGLSRSGLTVSVGRVLNLSRKDALDFSFLMAVPIIAGATVLSLKDILVGELLLPGLQVTAMAVALSFVSSMVAIMFLRTFVVKHSFAWFAPYLFALSFLTISLHVYG